MNNGVTKTSCASVHVPAEQSLSDPSLYALDEMAAAVKYNRWIARLVSAARPAPPKNRSLRFAEFGAGTGTLANTLGASLKRRAEVSMWEPYLKPVAKEHDFTRITLLKEWPETATFDVVFSSNVIEHIEDDAKAVRDMASAIVPGGRLVIYVPAFMSLFGPMDVKCGHHRRYRIADLDRLAEQAGLRVLARGYADPLGAMITWLFNALGKGVAPTSTSVGIYDRWLFPISRLMHAVFRPFFGKNVWIVAELEKKNP